ncbi:MAG TPA: homoserine dehydrogenase [Gemmatimonadaceae bacterium]|nr:homoserine dehydrogenase [Gemmatimonadaceae bacterium]
MSPPEVRIGVIGFGTVGRSFIEAFTRRRGVLEQAARVRFILAEIAVRDPRAKDFTIAGARVHNDAVHLASNPAIDLVIEVSGAAHAGSWILAALERGAAVATANKRALASHPLLLEALAERKPGLYCEASVAAAVPIVRALRDSLEGEEVRALRGVLNGTTTHVLSAIEHGASFVGALADARRLGICEGDAQLDLSGADAAHKLAILCTLAWSTPVSADHISVEGIGLPIEKTVRRAAERNTRVRLVAAATRRDGRITASVTPATLSADDPLAAATGVANVVEVETALAGTLRWTGPGAGGAATASALLADTLTAARWLAPTRHQRVAA